MNIDIAKSGLTSTSTQLETISNNIANVSTTGYKSARSEFASVFSGVRETGVEVVKTSQNFELNGAISDTGRSLDIAIEGRGFFMVRGNTQENLYTRSGIFNVNNDNFIVNNSGQRLQGYGVSDNGLVQTGAIGDLKISASSLDAEATDELVFTANLDARAQAPANGTFDPTDPTSFTSSYSTNVFDSLGNSHSVTQYFVKTSNPNEWDIHVTIDGQTPDTSPIAANPIVFDSDGLLQSGSPLNLVHTFNGSNQLNINMDVAGMTQYGVDFSVSENRSNGFSSGDLIRVSVDEKGQIIASYTNGQSQVQGQVVMADFTDPNALYNAGNTSWKETFASGVPVLGEAGIGIFGQLRAGALENSNVDLTSQMVDLMTAQRNYQANAKTLSTSEQLMQALFNAV